MKKVFLIMLTAAILFGFMSTLNHWKLKAQEEEFVPDLEQESDAEFVQTMNLLEDSELLEMLISDPDFLDVLEEFGEDIGIEEEGVPFDLLEENEDSSDLMSELEKSGKSLGTEKGGNYALAKEGRQK